VQTRQHPRCRPCCQRQWCALAYLASVSTDEGHAAASTGSISAERLRTPATVKAANYQVVTRQERAGNQRLWPQPLDHVSCPFPPSGTQRAMTARLRRPRDVHHRRARLWNGYCHDQRAPPDERDGRTRRGCTLTVGVTGASAAVGTG
jgi:hypothetical protein